MGEVRFMISEAAKQVDVESHVLRYWEEELGLTIGRTEMGHRYYTKDDIQLFRCIKKLKDEGMLLRDLKPLIPELKATRLRLRTPEGGKRRRGRSTECIFRLCGSSGRPCFRGHIRIPANRCVHADSGCRSGDCGSRDPAGKAGSDTSLICRCIPGSIKREQHCIKKRHQQYSDY